MIKRLVTLASTLLIALPTTALAVWGGAEDVAHPNVGAMYFDFLGTGVPISDGLICSGSFAGTSATAGPTCSSQPDTACPHRVAASRQISSSSPSIATAETEWPNPIQVEAYLQMPGFGHDAGDLRDLGILLLPRDSVAAGIPAGSAAASRVPERRSRQPARSSSGSPTSSDTA